MNHAVYYVDANAPEQNKQIPQDAKRMSLPDTATIDKQQLLTSLAKACDFPDYFAFNWDSAFDCLTDSQVHYLVIDLSHHPHINPTDWQALTQLINDAFTDFGKPILWVIAPAAIQPHHGWQRFWTPQPPTTI